MTPILPPLLHRLRTFPSLLEASLADLSPDDAHWQPKPGAWSIVQIVGHMLDEERDDFRTRLRSTLENPGSPWPPIDPERAVVERNHQEKPLDVLFDEWCKERADSIRWLKGQENAPWDNTYTHPALGELRAGDILVSWAQHDSLHLRQIVQRRYELTGRDGAPYEGAYAGPW